MKPTLALRSFLALTGSVFLAAQMAQAASGNWNVDAAGNWSTATNWSSNPTVPGTVAGDIIGLSNNIGGARTVTINSTSRTVGTLNIGDSNNTHAFTLASSGGATLTFDNGGAGASLNETGSVADVISASLILSDDLSVSVGGALTMSGLLFGDGNLTKSGAGTLTLGNTVNQFTGNTVISNGKVALGGQYSLWQSAYDTTGSTGAIGLNVTGQATPWLGGLAGSVNLATAITGYGSVTSLILNPQSGSSVSYGGVIANGAANMTLNKTGHGTQTLTGTNTYSGATTVWAGTLALAGASGTAQNSAFTVRGGTLLLDNSTAWADRLNNSTALSLGSLTLTSSNGAGIQTETVGATTFAVGGKVTINNGSTPGDQTTLAMGAVTRSAGAAIDFVGTGGTLGGGADSPNVTSSSLPANTNGILPWATVNGTQWAENNSNSIRAYSGSFFDINSSTNAQNAQLSGTGSLSGARVANSLNIIATASGQSLSLGANNLTLGSAAASPGAILKSGADAYTISGTGQVRAGSAGAGTELIAHVDGGALTISAPLNTAIVGIAKGGTGDLILSGTRAGTMSGAISIAGGQLEFRGNSTTLSGVVTGAGGLTVNLNAGQTLNLTNNSNSYAGPTIVKGGYLSSDAFSNEGIPGGRGQTPGTNTSLIMSNLTLQGGVWYSRYITNKDLGAGPGQVQVLAGTSGFAHDASQGGAAGFTLDGGREIVWGSTYFNPTVFVHNTTGNLTLNLANGFDLAGSTRTVLVGDATINTANGVSQLGGNIRNSSGTAGLTKTGTGTLLLSGTNSYNGATTISSGILRFQNQVSLYNNTPASWTAANIVVANTGTLALNVGGTGQFTTGNVTTLLTSLGGANGTSTTGFAAGSSIGFDTTNASGGTFTVADNITDSSGTGGGAIGLVKLGNNTLVLSGTTNSYSGATIIRGGTLSLTGSLTGGTAITTSNNNNGGGGTALQGVINQSAASVISGAASITQGSSGTSTLSGNNSYTGNTTITAGTLVIGHANALGDGTGTIRLNGGTIQSSSATARSFSNPVTIGGNFTVGGTGNMTFSNTGASALGATRQITVNSGINATFAQAFSGSTFGITKAGAGTLTLTGNNTYTGATTINAGTVVLNNNGDVTGSAVSFAGSDTGLTVTGGSGVTSIWNAGGGDFGTSNSALNNIQVLIDGAGTAGSARVTNVNILNWGKSATNSTLTLTNGGQMNVNGEIRTGNPYYSTTGNADIIIGGGTATSTFTGNNQAFYIGYGERNASKDNDVTVNSGGVLTNIGNMFVGHVNYGSALGTSTNNKLTVDGTGTASMASVTVGYAQVATDAANANVVQVTGGGTLTTSGTNYIGRTANIAGTSNANTLTVTGTGSTWNAGNQTVNVGFTGTNAGANSNNNILTVSAGGSLTNVSSLVLGSGSGTETGNKVVLNGGSISTTSVTVNASNTLEFGVNGGTLTGNITNNGTLNFGSNVAVSLAGNISGTTGSITQTGTGTTTLSGTNSYTGTTRVDAGTLQFAKMVSLNNNVDTNWTAAKINVKSGATLAVNVDSAGTNGFTAAKMNTLFGNISVANTAAEGLQAGSIIGLDTSTATGGTFTQGNAIADSTGASGGAIGVTKLGTGTLDLDQTNTYTGATNVNAGTLQVSGAGSINTTSAINVAAGARFVYNSTTALSVAPTLNGSGSNKATFSGSGTINAAMTLNNIDDVLAPGNSPGIQDFGADQTWTSFTYEWEVKDWVASVAGTDFDQIDITGELVLDGSAYALDVLSLTTGDVAGNVHNFTESSKSWIILTTSGGISGFDALEWDIDTAGFTNPDTGTWGLNQVGNNLVLNYSAIPEPSSALLVGLSSLLLFRRRR